MQPRVMPDASPQRLCATLQHEMGRPDLDNLHTSNPRPLLEVGHSAVWHLLGSDRRHSSSFRQTSATLAQGYQGGG